MPQLTGRDMQSRAEDNANAVVSAWQVVRGRYPAAVRSLVDDVSEAGGVTLTDLILMTVAELESVLDARKRLDPDDIGERLKLTQAATSLRRQVGQFVIAAGGGSKVDGLVPIPEDVDAILRESEPDYTADLIDG